MTPTVVLNMLVSDVLAASPAAARVFVERGMGCVGCPFAPFETVSEAAREYGIQPSELANALAAMEPGEPFQALS
jgi:hybrid cluster-associated redox disulfide protein